MRQVRADYRTAKISEKLRAMLALLETFTLHPEQLSPDKVRVVIDAGVSRDAIRDAFYVAFLFNTYDRLADTLGWELPEKAYYLKAGQRLFKHGYQ
jgi:alkylhydroperoxidase family enzyme